MNLDWIGGRAVFEHHRLEIMAKGVHYRCQNTKMGGDPANRAKRHISFMQPLGKISLKKCREPGFWRGLYQKKICLTPPGRDQADFVSTAIMIIWWTRCQPAPVIYRIEILNIMTLEFRPAGDSLNYIIFLGLYLNLFQYIGCNNVGLSRRKTRLARNGISQNGLNFIQYVTPLNAIG